MKIKHLNLLHLVSVFLLGSSSSFATENEVNIWSPNELLREGGGKLWDNVTEFTVEFRVASLRLVPTTYPNGDRRNVPHLVPAGEDDFSVPISQELEASLKMNGITDLNKHFKDKVLRIRGRISQTGLNLIGSETIWTFHLH